jgi:hypothetical protein
MKRLLLSETFEAFLYLTTSVLLFFSMFLAMAEAPDTIQMITGIPGYSLLVASLYYGTWRGIQRRKED